MNQTPVRTSIATRWRYANDGIQLSASLWWAAYIAPSEKQPGKWWWKTHTGTLTEPAPSGYADTPEAALVKVREGLAVDRLYDYTIPEDAVALQLLRALKLPTP